MKIQQLIEQMLMEQFNPSDEYYHTGPNFEKFSGQFMGSGENNHLLGHGLYFINNDHVAKRYAKYSVNPHMYTVRFNAPATSFYNTQERPTAEQAANYDAIAQELGYPDRQSVPYRHSIMKYGRGLPGAVFSMLGTKKGQVLLIKHNIVGQTEHIDGDIYEVAVYDESIIQILNKESVPGGKEPDPNPMSDEEWNAFLKSFDQ